MYVSGPDRRSPPPAPGRLRGSRGRDAQPEVPERPGHPPHPLPPLLVALGQKIIFGDDIGIDVAVLRRVSPGVAAEDDHPLGIQRLEPLQDLSLQDLDLSALIPPLSRIGGGPSRSADPHVPPMPKPPPPSRRVFDHRSRKSSATSTSKPGIRWLRTHPVPRAPSRSTRRSPSNPYTSTIQYSRTPARP